MIIILFKRLVINKHLLIEGGKLSKLFVVLKIKLTDTFFGHENFGLSLGT